MLYWLALLMPIHVSVAGEKGNAGPASRVMVTG